MRLVEFRADEVPHGQRALELLSSLNQQISYKSADEDTCFVAFASDLAVFTTPDRAEFRAEPARADVTQLGRLIRVLWSEVRGVRDIHIDQVMRVELDEPESASFAQFLIPDSFRDAIFSDNVAVATGVSFGIRSATGGAEEISIFGYDADDDGVASLRVQSHIHRYVTSATEATTMLTTASLQRMRDRAKRTVERLMEWYAQQPAASK